MGREGAELAFTYQGERLKGRVEELAAEVGSEVTVPCDVASDSEIRAVFEHLDNFWDHFDILVHAVAFAPREQLEGNYLDTVTREGFRIAHEISSYSFTALAMAHARVYRTQRCDADAHYLGAVRAMPSYNVMDSLRRAWRANVRYMAQDLGPRGSGQRDLRRAHPHARGGRDHRFRRFLDHVEKTAPSGATSPSTRRERRGLPVLDLASAITGEITKSMPDSMSWAWREGTSRGLLRASAPRRPRLWSGESVRIPGCFRLPAIDGIVNALRHLQLQWGNGMGKDKLISCSLWSSARLRFAAAGCGGEISSSMSTSTAGIPDRSPDRLATSSSFGPGRLERGEL